MTPTQRSVISLLLLVSLTASAAAKLRPIPVKVVVVTMFELGADTGDQPGELRDAWAAQWVPYFTGGKGVFATTAMEDTGTLQSLTFLANAGRVDANRILVLRAVSNFDRQPLNHWAKYEATIAGSAGESKP